MIYFPTCAFLYFLTCAFLSRQGEVDDKACLMALKVTGLTDDTIMHRDVKGVFESKGIKTIVYFDRFESLGHEGYLIFRSDDKPETLLRECGFVDGAKATVKSASIEFTKPDDGEKDKIFNLYFRAKQKFASRPFKQRKQGRQQNKRPPKRKGGTKTNLDSDDEGEKPPNEPSEKSSKLD